MTAAEWRERLAAITILSGDCRDLIRDIPDGVIDLVVADPPYGIDYQSNRRAEKSKAIANDDDDARAILFDMSRDLQRVMATDSHLYLFCDLIEFWGATVLRHLKLDDILIWAKGRGMGPTDGSGFVEGYEAILFYTKGNRKLIDHPCNLIDAGRPSKHDRLHPTQKPIYALSKLIHASSQPGDVVLDFTAGSGATGAACRSFDPGEERKVILMDCDPEYVETMKQRLRFSGRIAEKLPC